MPFQKFLGIRFIKKLEDGALVELRLRDEHLNKDGVIHGGVTAALADSALGMAIAGHRDGARMTTVEMKVNFLRPAKSGTLRARAKFVKNGRRLVVGTVDIHDSDNRQVATALLTYMMLDGD